MALRLVSFGAGARRAEAEKPTNRGGSLVSPLGFKLLYQQLSRALVPQRPHRLVVAPNQMLRQLMIQIINTSEGLPVVEIPLIVPVAPLDLPIMPRRPRRDQLVLDAKPAQLLVKRTLLCLADIFVGKLRPIICLDRLDPEWEYLYQHPKKLHRVLRRMLLKTINKP